MPIPDPYTMTLGAAIPDHGMQAWADGYALQFGLGPVKIQGYVMEASSPISPVETVPPGQVLETVRLKDGVHFPGSSGSILYRNPDPFAANWFAMAGGSTYGVTFFATLFNVTGGGTTFVSGAFFPDRTRVDAEVGHTHPGVVYVMATCAVSAGDGAHWKLLYPSRGLLGLGDHYIYDLDFASIAVSSSCGGGGDGGGGGGTQETPEGIDVLCWKEGYHIAQAGNNAIQVIGRWHPELGASAGSIPSATIDTGALFYEPKLAHPPWGPPLSVTYRRETSNGSQGLFRKESYDYGQTWIADPAGGGAYKPVKHGVEVWNGRTGERVTLYNDGTAKDSAGKLTGKGAIKADVYGPHLDENTGLLKFVATYAVTEPGALADDSSFGAIWIDELGAIDCVVMIAAAAKTYRSIDDARTWLST